MRRRANILLFIMVIYMFASFCWWTILLLEKNKETFIVERQVLELKANSNIVKHAELLSQGNALDEKYERQRKMILGEALIMMILLMAGSLQLSHSLKKEFELNQRQKNFLLSITHELKSPIASAVLSFQTLLKRHKLDDEKHNRLVNNGLSDMTRLKELVDNLLLSARIENHSYEPCIENCMISDLVLECLSKTREHYGNTRKIEWDISPDLILQTDKTAIQTIMINLLDNAVKYTEPGAVIYTTLKDSDNQVVLTVADSGKGIADIEKKKVFDKFYRIGNEETRTAAGTGIGLFMVKELVDLLKGKIEIADNKPNGTVFKIAFTKH